ncbi:MAG: SDR family oxidoreductase [Cuniculiplasma sp.]
MLSGKPFEGKGVIITGGGSGLGQAMCLKFAEYGAKVYSVGRTESKLRDTKRIVNQIGGEMEYGAIDIRDYENISKFISQAFEGSKIVGLVNNAAGNFISKTEDLSMNAFKSVLDIVLLGSINSSITAAKRWMEKNMQGSIVNILTTYAQTGSAYVTPSAAAKGGLRSFTRSVAVEWGPKGIRTNGIAPGPFKTEGAWKNLLPDESVEKFLIDKNPMKRLGTFEDITELVSYLVSDFSSYINGDVITIDGGEWLKGAGQFNMLSELDDGTWEEMKKNRRKKE